MALLREAGTREETQTNPKMYVSLKGEAQPWLRKSSPRSMVGKALP